MGVPLVPRRARVFDEINDIVGCDLVLVMDSFDATEVHLPSPQRTKLASPSSLAA
jgi:hypothetical protein